MIYFILNYDGDFINNQLEMRYTVVAIIVFVIARYDAIIRKQKVIFRRLFAVFKMPTSFEIMATPCANEILIIRKGKFNTPS